MARWPTLVPLGNLAVTAAGSTVLLSANCGPLGGQIGAPGSGAGVPGTPFRQLILCNKGAGNAFLLPRGNTASANPTTIFAIIPSGGMIPFPHGLPFENGILPENFCVDGDAACTVYGCGIL